MKMKLFLIPCVFLSTFSLAMHNKMQNSLVEPSDEMFIPTSGQDCGDDQDNSFYEEYEEYDSEIFFREINEQKKPVARVLFGNVEEAAGSDSDVYENVPRPDFGLEKLLNQWLEKTPPKEQFKVKKDKHPYLVKAVLEKRGFQQHRLPDNPEDSQENKGQMNIGRQWDGGPGHKKHPLFMSPQMMHFFTEKKQN